MHLLVALLKALLLIMMILVAEASLIILCAIPCTLKDRQLTLPEATIATIITTTTLALALYYIATLLHL